MLRIKEFADLCGCSVYTLRYYDQIDLLRPSIVNENSGYRFYEERQVKAFNEIKEFQEIGFNIMEIRSLKEKTNDEIGHMILKKVDYIESLLDKALILKEKYIEGK